ncbi:MAG TPA: alpha-ketoacid dehydrogenase subunit beta [Jatrophihabitans sp.]|jgi:pyruvate dehydrogenase E1 component beta subunit|nr:alpha-ketoacid dehydrogenase subunit beta [Jatrophihabitans sp.]
MASRTLAQAITLALDNALGRSDDIIVLGEDVGRTGGVFRITDGLRAKHGAHRVVDTPLAESGIVGTALGLAVAGMRPVVELQFMGFSYPAFDQIISHVARMRHRTRHRFTVPMVIRIPYGGGIGAAEHHSESTETIYAHIPGLKVVVPSRPADAAGMLRAAIEDPDPVIFLEPIRMYRSVKEEVPDDSPPARLDTSTVERLGSDITLVSWGAMMKETREAAEKLAASGVSAEVVDLRCLAPMNVDTLAASVRKTGRAVVIHEAPRSAGLGAEVIASLQEHCAYDLEAPVARVTGWDTVIPLKMAEHHYLPSTERIVTTAERVLAS